jgi:phage replication O-like protein O
MANPQLENGRTEIANDIVDVLAKTYLSPAESKVLWFILRKTYGYHKPLDWIAYSQFEEGTGLDRRHVGPALQRLIQRKIVITTGSGERRKSEYGLQKDYELWQLTPESVTKSDTDLSNKLTPKQVTDLPSTTGNLTPVSVPSDTGLEKSDTDLSNKSDTDLSNHKSNKAIDKSNRQKQSDIFQLPVWVNKDTWESFLEMRIKIRKPATASAKILLIKKLENLKFQGFDPNAILEQSIMNSWQGLFEIRNQLFGGSQNGKQGHTQLPNNAFHKPQPPSEKPHYIDGDAPAPVQNT